MAEAVLISIHPRYAEKIVRGTKKVEFRRAWAKREVSHIVVYATSPRCEVVAIVAVSGVVKGSISKMWALARSYGGGVTQEELDLYFRGKECGYAVLLGHVTTLVPPIRLSDVALGARAPQSYQYLTTAQFNAIYAQFDVKV